MIYSPPTSTYATRTASGQATYQQPSAGASYNQCVNTYDPSEELLYRYIDWTDKLPRLNHLFDALMFFTFFVPVVLVHYFHLFTPVNNLFFPSNPTFLEKFTSSHLGPSLVVALFLGADLYYLYQTKFTFYAGFKKSSKREKQLFYSAALTLTMLADYIPLIVTPIILMVPVALAIFGISELALRSRELLRKGIWKLWIWFLRKYLQLKKRAKTRAQKIIASLSKAVKKQLVNLKNVLVKGLRKLIPTKLVQKFQLKKTKMERNYQKRKFRKK